MIRKWPVPLGEVVELPPEAEPIHVGIQAGELVVWTNDNAGLALLGVPQRVFWFGTGFTPEQDSRYVGTVQEEDGFVWHLFRLPLSWTPDATEMT